MKITVGIMLIILIILISLIKYEEIPERTELDVMDEQIVYQLIMCIKGKEKVKRKELLDIGFSYGAVEDLIRNRYLDEFYAECITDMGVKINGK